MKPLTDFISQDLPRRWHEPRVAAVVSIVAGIATYLPLANSGHGTDPLTIVTAGLMALLIAAVWEFQHYIPKTAAKKIGIVVAVSSEDDAEAKRIHEDFVSQLRALLESDRACAQFHVIVLQGSNARAALQSDRALEILKIARGHILFYGTAKRRQLGGRDVHMLKLEAVVRHALIPKEASEHFSKELTEILPTRLHVPVDGDALSFEATSRWVGLGAKFAVGVAAGFGRNLPFAEALFLDIERQLKTTGRDAAFLQPLARNVTKHIEMVYVSWLFSLADEYFMRRDTRILEKSHELGTKLISRNTSEPGVYFHHALSTFMLFRNVAMARSLVLTAMKKGDKATGHYNLAFLHAYEGNLEKAHSEYRRAFRAPASNPTVSIQCEEFIEKVIEAEPARLDLTFCTGLINYNAKEDYDAAAREFRRFLEWTGSRSSKSSREKAEQLLAKCGERNTAIEFQDGVESLDFSVGPKTVA